MKKAPDFTLPDQDGNLHSLDDYAGKWLVIYFYPKDDTPGCTIEACAFRDGRDVLREHGAEIIGISKDSVKSHDKFAQKHDLNFTLLSDESTKTIEAYGAWAEKSMFGKKYMGIKRNTYLLNPQGYILKSYENVNPRSHFKEILDDLKELVK